MPPLFSALVYLCLFYGFSNLDSEAGGLCPPALPSLSEVCVLLLPLLLLQGPGPGWPRCREGGCCKNQLPNTSAASDGPLPRVQMCHSGQTAAALFSPHYPCRCPGTQHLERSEHICSGPMQLPAGFLGGREGFGGSGLRTQAVTLPSYGCSG